MHPTDTLTTPGRAEFSRPELKMAEHLVEMMSGQWSPEDYRDEYREDLLKLIEKKVKSGQTKAVEKAGPEVRSERRGKVIDMVHLLRQSLDQARKKEEPAQHHRKAS